MAMAAGYGRVVAETQRLRVLQLLEGDPEGACSADELRAGLEAVEPRRISYRRVRDLLDWLAGKDLVAIEDRGTRLTARITERGEDVALGGSSFPGVARPRRRF